MIMDTDEDRGSGFSMDMGMDFISGQDEITTNNGTTGDFYFSNSTPLTEEAEFYVKNKTQKFPVAQVETLPLELITTGSIFMIIFAIIGIIFNFISILALSKCKSLRRITTAFIVNLCIAGFAFSCFNFVNSSFMLKFRHWNGGNKSCKFYNILMYFCIITSMFTLVAITLNRYIAIVHPKRYQMLYSVRNTVIMIAFIWILPLVLILLPFLEIWGKLDYDPVSGECTITNLNGTSPKIFIRAVAFIIPLILFLLCYTRIYFVVRKAERNVEERKCGIISRFKSSRFRSWLPESAHKPEAPTYKHQNDKKEFRLLQIILVIFLSYILCFIPLAVLKILHKERDLHILNVVCHLAVHFSASIQNPVLYILMSEDYRKAFKELFRQNTENL